jgi:hypothetical protein
MKSFKSFLESRDKVPVVKTDIDDLHRELASHEFSMRRAETEKAKEYHRQNVVKVLAKMKKNWN